MEPRRRLAFGAGKFLRYLPDMPVRIGECHRSHAPWSIVRAAQQSHARLVQVRAYRIHVINDDGELAGALRANPLVRPEQPFRAVDTLQISDPP